MDLSAMWLLESTFTRRQLREISRGFSVPNAEERFDSKSELRNRLRIVSGITTQLSSSSNYATQRVWISIGEQTVDNGTDV